MALLRPSLLLASQMLCSGSSLLDLPSLNNFSTFSSHIHNLPIVHWHLSHAPVDAYMAILPPSSPFRRALLSTLVTHLPTFLILSSNLMAEPTEISNWAVLELSYGGTFMALWNLWTPLVFLSTRARMQRTLKHVEQHTQFYSPQNTTHSINLRKFSLKGITVPLLIL